MKTKKKGISLIVLVITIIVMIILATAIILSLNSSNISGKAGEAKLSSDLANKKEAASVFLSEYEIKKAKGKIDSTTLDAYVKSECKKAGIDTSDIAVTEDGIILVGIAAMLVNQNVPIGAAIDGYIPSGVEEYTTTGRENTCGASETETSPQPATVYRDESITWNYFGIDENGNALILGSVSDETSAKIKLGGKGGYVYGPQYLNDICKAMYSSKMGTARSIDINDIIRVLKYTGEKGSYGYTNAHYDAKTEKAYTVNELADMLNYDMSNFGKETPEPGKDIGTYKSDGFVSGHIDGTEAKQKYNFEHKNLIFSIKSNTLRILYWLASPHVKANFYTDYQGFVNFGVRGIGGTEIGYIQMFYSRNASFSGEASIRPVVTLNPSVQMTYENDVVKLK